MAKIVVVNLWDMYFMSGMMCSTMGWELFFETYSFLTGLHGLSWILYDESFESIFV